MKTRCGIPYITYTEITLHSRQYLTLTWDLAVTNVSIGQARPCRFRERIGKMIAHAYSVRQYVTSICLLFRSLYCLNPTHNLRHMPVLVRLDFTLQRARLRQNKQLGLCYIIYAQRNGVSLRYNVLIASKKCFERKCCTSSLTT